jgi:hypothetical protein
MRRASLLLAIVALTGCAPRSAIDTRLAVPIADVAEHRIEGPAWHLTVPTEDLAQHPGPRPQADLAVPEE